MGCQTLRHLRGCLYSNDYIPAKAPVFTPTVVSFDPSTIDWTASYNHRCIVCDKDFKQAATANGVHVMGKTG